jgi:hypothetical protein
MAYVKLKKAAGDFDILSSENVASVKLATSTEDGLLVVNFIGDIANNITIKPVDWVVGTDSTHFVQADVTALNKAIGLISGGSGMIDVSLSKVVDEVTYATA